MNCCHYLLIWQFNKACQKALLHIQKKWQNILPPIIRKNIFSMHAKLCNQDVTFKSSMNILAGWCWWSFLPVIIEKWKHWFIHCCCWHWQQMHDWVRAFGCERKDTSSRSEAKTNRSVSRLTESSSQLSGINPLICFYWGDCLAPVIILMFCVQNSCEKHTRQIVFDHHSKHFQCISMPFLLFWVWKWACLLLQAGAFCWHAGRGALCSSLQNSRSVKFDVKLMWLLSIQ